MTSAPQAQLPRAPALPEIPGFEVVGVLGRGGMAIVYKARQVALDRWVAIKMMRPDIEIGFEGLKRFLIEARNLASLQHPNIVQIYEVGVLDAGPYLVLELVEGGSLDHKLHGQPQPVREAAQLVETLARAVEVAHAHGVIHRDLKPGNVLLTASGVPRIADFGIAKRVGEERLTRTGAMMGTPNYMAPEQVSSTGTVGPAVDVYALGGILYFLLVGQAPFSGSTEAVLHSVCVDIATEPRRLRPEIPRDLETICRKCLDKDPARRYLSANALADDLHRFLAGEPIVARPVSIAGRLTRWSRRHPTTAVLGGLSAALLATIAIGATVVALQLAEQDRELATERDAEAAARIAADDSRKVATEQRGLAIGAFRTLVTTIQDKLRDKPELRAVRREVLDDALAGLRTIARSGDAESLSADRATAMAHQQLGDAFAELGQAEDAKREYDRTLAMLEALAKANPDSDWQQWTLSIVDSSLGKLADHRGDVAEARARFHAAVDAARAVDAHPHGTEFPPERVLERLEDSYASLTVLDVDLAASGDAVDDATHVLDVLARQRKLTKNPDDILPTVVDGYQFRAIARYQADDLAGAEADDREALAAARHAIDVFPLSLQAKVMVGQIEEELAVVLVAEGRRADALSSCSDAIGVLRLVRAADPELAQVSHGLADLLEIRADLEGHGSAAVRYDAEAAQLRADLAAIDPTDVFWRIGKLHSLARTGHCADALPGLRAVVADLHHVGQMYLAATVFAECGELDAAAHEIDAAIAAGYRAPGELRHDPDLAALRARPEFAEWLRRASMR